jgi:methyl-accepting chemotaxis protein
VVARDTSQQAASIQETSRSAGLITATIRQNADHSGSAAQLMKRTAELIADANRSLDQMQSSMTEINSSCEQVGRIIKVVDEIAFQTNILALNAAVEAARAGESGLGFAVVATEVRNLAQRSAKAANETTGLIETSIGKSRDGRSHFENVAAAIGKVTASATEVASLVDRINGDSTQQAQDAQSIAQSIGGMESVTQSSAAAAQETAAIGEEMSVQAETLKTIAQQLHAIVG